MKPVIHTRIRGHYRIDADGRIVPLVENRDSVLAYAPAVPSVAFPVPSVSRRNSPVLVEWCVVAALIAILGMLLNIGITRLIRNDAAFHAAQAAAARAAIIQANAQRSANSPQHK